MLSADLYAAEFLEERFRIMSARRRCYILRLLQLRRAASGSRLLKRTISILACIHVFLVNVKCAAAAAADEW